MNITTAYGVTPFRPHQYQSLTKERIDSRPYNAILSPRQFGKDTTVLWSSMERLKGNQSTLYITVKQSMIPSHQALLIDDSITIIDHMLCHKESTISFHSHTSLYQLISHDTWDDFISQFDHVVLAEVAYFNDGHFKTIVDALLDTNTTITMITTPTQFRGYAYKLYHEDNQFKKTYWRRFIHPLTTPETLRAHRNYYEKLLGKDIYDTEFNLRW